MWPNCANPARPSTLESTYSQSVNSHLHFGSSQSFTKRCIVLVLTRHEWQDLSQHESTCGPSSRGRLRRGGKLYRTKLKCEWVGYEACDKTHWHTLLWIFLQRFDSMAVCYEKGMIQYWLSLPLWRPSTGSIVISLTCFCACIFSIEEYCIK